MKISGIDNLDVGMSNIEIEGEVTYTMTPRLVEGDNDKGHYEFYSQFVVIADETGKIGCGISIEKEEHKLAKGVIARVKGKLEEYKDKKGQMVRKIQGKLVAISKGDKVTDVQQEVAEGYFEEKGKEAKVVPIVQPVKAVPKVDSNIWEAKDLRIARECAVKAVTELVCAGVMESKEYFSFANTIVKYIYNGISKEQKEEKEAEPTKAEKITLAQHIAKGSKLELREGHHSLVDDDDEEPGSSFNNSVPYAGKKKALKKINEAEDYISDSDMPS